MLSKTTAIPWDGYKKAACVPTTIGLTQGYESWRIWRTSQTNLKKKKYIHTHPFLQSCITSHCTRKLNRERAASQWAEEMSHIIVLVPLHHTSKANEQNLQCRYSSSPRFPAHPSVSILASRWFTVASRIRLCRKIMYFSVPQFLRWEQFCLPSPQRHCWPHSPVLQTPQTPSRCWTQTEENTDNLTHRIQLPLVSFLTQRN